MISYRIAFNNALYNGEFAWGDILSDSERQHYERCITALSTTAIPVDQGTGYCQDSRLNAVIRTT